MNNLFPIIMTKEGVSDDFYLINELYKTNASAVKKGDLILCFETSKIAIDMESPTDGYIFFDIKKNDKVQIGQTIAVVSKEKDFSYKNWFQVDNKPKTEIKKTRNSNIKISKPAQKLIHKNQIDIAVFKNLSLITTSDVENYLLNLSETNTILEIPPVNKTSVVIFGAGGHAKMCIDIVKQTKDYKIIGIVDDSLAPQTKIFDIPVLGKPEILNKLIATGLQNVILGIGGVLSKGIRIKKFNYIKELALNIPTIIHPSASLEPSVFLGEGNQIMQGAILGSNVKIGNNCIINSGSIISHDTIIGNNVHIAPGAIIGGGVTIKDNTIIGMGCTIFLGLTIGKNVTIQNGIHIFNNVIDNKNIQ